MKIIRTKGRSAQHAEEVFAALERRGGDALDTVLPAVRRIVAAVRKQGDTALFRFAAEFDGLADASKVRVAPGRDGGSLGFAQPCAAARPLNSR